MIASDFGHFLADRGHGVLAFNTSEPYAIPVSYGYDVTTDRCFLQLSFGRESRKREHLEESNGVSLVVYEWKGMTDWRSVLITGVLREMTESEYPEAAEVYFYGAAMPDPSAFSERLEAIDIVWYELVMRTLDERVSSGEIF